MAWQIGATTGRPAAVSGASDGNDIVFAAAASAVAAAILGGGDCSGGGERRGGDSWFPAAGVRRDGLGFAAVLRLVRRRNGVVFAAAARAVAAAMLGDGDCSGGDERDGGEHRFSPRPLPSGRGGGA